MKTKLRLMQGIIIGLLIGVFISSGIVSAEQRSINATYRNIQISLDGTIIPTDVESFILDGRTMVPVSFIVKALGMNVKYNELTDIVEITSPVNKGGNAVDITTTDNTIDTTTTDTTTETVNPTENTTTELPPSLPTVPDNSYDTIQ